ncbi:hypothetical protein [Citrobacter sp. TSA-1]|uniref:hypothetical protein n=1 Tax=Citrobacter sp. TSA-1 TaxID=184912 RepID=UPI00144A4DB7|nr:hypothetical protein [Citrobacter sp. TSA-1]
MKISSNGLPNSVLKYALQIISAEMKNLLLRQLSQIQDALESYDILGIEPVMDAIQSTIGLTALHPGIVPNLKMVSFPLKSRYYFPMRQMP